MKKVFISAAKRTAIGSFLGSLSTISAAKLGEELIRGLVNESKLDPKLVDEVILGNILMAGAGQGIARQASINAGLPEKIPAYTINMICGSGLKSLMIAYSEIKAQEADIIIAGGSENMSQAPFLIPQNVRNGHKMGDMKAKDHMVFDALTDAFSGKHMGLTAENIAQKYNISRKAQDEFAYNSQQKAIKAVDSGRFKDEIIPINIKLRKESLMMDTDEYPNRKSSLEKLASLRAVFKEDGSVTAGNASGINDGSAGFIIASEEGLKKASLNPLVEIVAVAEDGCDPAFMGLGPIGAIKKVLAKAKLKLQDIELLELNEAFAAQSLAVLELVAKEHEMDKNELLKRTNVNGGAIALGHPVGSSGARIGVSLIHEMLKRGSKLGLASLCIGGGMGVAAIFRAV